MNKNPFVPQSSYQPPLPPGPPPPQPDYSGYWSAGQQPPLPAQQPSFNQQWSPAQPPRPPAEQSSLYANYGYGTQHNNWRQQQQQQHFHPPVPVQPPPQPGYNPYQPTAGYTQPYVPQAQPMAQMPFVQHPQHQQQPFFPQPFQHQPPMQMQQQRPQIHHTPPQQLPPAKRQRFDAPNQRPPPQQPQFQPPSGPMQTTMFSGPQRGGGPPNAGGRGGQAARGARGGRGGGGSFSGNRGTGISGRGGRGAGNGFAAGGMAGPRGGPSGAQLRGHGSRGNFANKDFHNRRGGSFQNSSGSFRGRGHPGNSGRNRNDGGNSTFGTRDGPSNSSYSSGKKDENRRTLTDFKIIGLEIRELAWTWGVVPSSVKAEPEELSLAADAPSQDQGGADGELKAVPDGPKVISDAGPPPSRMRIYFHTPVTAVDSHPIPNNSSFSVDTVPSDSRKGKRKKIESDDGDDEERREPPPPPGMNDDRSSVAASVAPSVAESASEGDWLMAAISGDGDGDSHEFDGDAVTEEAETDGNFADGTPRDDDDEHGVPEGASSDHVEHDISGSIVSLSTLVSPSPDVPASSSNEPVSTSLGPTAPEGHPVDSAAIPAVDVASAVAEQSTSPLSGAATLLSIESLAASSIAADATVIFSQNTYDDEQTQELEATQIDDPPPSLSVSATSTTNGDVSHPFKTTSKVPAANRLSISYEGGNRRLVLDAEIVESMTLFRREGRAEVQVNLVADGETGLKGVLMETLSDVTKSYHPIESTTTSYSDLPPFSQVSTPLAITLIVYLDTVRPLSEPKWVKTGDIPEWLKSLFGRMFWFAGDASESWEKKIVVSDPDPPPTLSTVLEGWSTSSGAGTLTERQRFLKTHLSEIDNILEILLRLVRGNQPTPLASQTGSPLTGPLLSSISPGSLHGPQQTPVSLAVLAMFRMTVEYANEAGGDKGKTDAEGRMGEIIRCLPPSQIHKSLDAIFKEWKNSSQSDKKK